MKQRFYQINKILLCVLLLVGLLTISSIAQAANRYAVATGNWNSTSTWSTTSNGTPGASVPGAADNVIINQAYTITLTTDVACKNLEFGNTGVIAMGAFNLTVSGDLVFKCTTGTFTTTSGYVVLNGSTQTINLCTGGGNSIPNLRLTNSTKVSMVPQTPLTIGNFDCQTGSSTFTNMNAEGWNSGAFIVTGTCIAPNCSFIAGTNINGNSMDFSACAGTVQVGGITNTQSNANVTFGNNNVITETPFVGSGQISTGTGTVTVAKKQFRSRQTGNWNSSQTWEVSKNDGQSWLTSTNTPSATDDLITVRTGHVVTVSSAVSIDQTIVETGGQITVNNGITLTIVNGNGTDLIVSGKVVNTGTITTTGSVAFENGSTYQHNINGGTIPTATWNAASNCNITGITNAATLGGLAQTFGNFTWNCTAQTISFYLATNMNIAGDFSVLGTGTTDTNNRTLRMSSNATGYTISVSGNVVIGNATFKMNNNTGACTLNVGKDFILNNAGSYFVLVTGNASSTVNVNGNVNISNGSLILTEESTYGTLNVKGDFTHTGGTIDESVTYGAINFNGTSMQTYTTGGTINNDIRFTVNNGAYLQMAANNTTVNGGGTFTVANGGTLGVTSTTGITTSGTNGNIRVTGTRTFNTGANYTYNGTAAQVTGNGLTGVNNLTINNSAGVTLSRAIAVSGTITLNATTLRSGATTGNAITGGILDVASNSTIALGTGVHTLNFANSNGTWAASSLTITGWTGTAGASGTAGKIVVGDGGLSTAQLDKISFTGFAAGATIVSGEVVPSVSVPTITTFSPSSVCVGNTVTITGTNFTGATSVKFNGVEATSFTVVNATSITAIPASATTGTITVTTPGETATSSSSITIVSPSGDETTFGAGSWIGYAYESSTARAFSKYIGYVAENEIFNRDFDTSCSGQLCGVTSDLCSTPTDLFAIRYKMTKTFPAGSYTFTIGGDDGVRLYVNEDLLIDDWSDHGYRERAGTICLDGSTNLIIEFYENGGQARVSFNYSYISSPTTTGVTICQGGNGSLTASVCPTGTLDWYTASSGGTKIGSGSPFNPVGVSGSGLPNTNTSGTTTFYAECSASPGCRTATSFLINANPTVNAGSPVVAILQGGTTAALGGSFGGSATAAIWSDGGAGGSFSNNGGTTPGTATYTASSNSASPVTLTLTTSGGLCGTTSASKQLTVSSNLTASISKVNATDYCTADGSATVSPTGGSGSYSYSWSPSGGNSATASNLSVGEYTVTVTDNVSHNNKTYSVKITTAYGAGCATAGKDGDATINSAPNTNYTAVSLTINAGATEIELNSATSLSAGDLLLVIQMQGADMNITNSSSYGATSNVTAGFYEYVAIESVNSSYAYLKAPLVNTYENINSTTTTGRKRFQIIKVPQYNNLTLTGNITVSAWNGTSGGIFAVDVAGTLNMGGHTISADGAGFRGGAGVNSGTAGGTPNFINDYVFPIGTAGQGYKGEGIAGTPASVYNGSAIVSTGSNYQTGDKGKGAPGNAGGGANDAVADNGQNSGGGGGANISPGGSGGRTWNSNLANGGFGGKSFTGSENAVILGGGGGAGTINATNPLPHGGVGGGIVIIHAGTISNAGTITANGTNAPNTLNEGAGGGGAGGSIIISATSGLNNITATANGGKGGDAWPLEAPGGSPGQRHGPGGGGSGGAIYSTGTLASFSILAGANGITTTANDAYGSTAGSAGNSSTIDDNDLSTTILGRNCPVLDNTAPTITCPSDVITCAGNVPTALTAFSDFNASDTGSGLSCITYTETGSEASGTITREYTIYDKAGNYSTCTHVLTVSPPPVITTQPSNTTICEGGSVSFTVVTSASSPTYQWQYLDVATWRDIPSAIIPVTTSSNLQASGVTVDYNNFSVHCVVTANGCSTTSDPALLTVNALPATPTASNDGPICAGSTLTLSTPSVIGASYSWTGPNSFTSSSQNPTIANATAAATGTYSVTVTVNACTSSAGTTTVTVNTPSVEITTPYVEDCPELIPEQGFEPNNTSYDAGSTKITFVVNISGTSATTWSFDYELTGATIRTGLTGPNIDAYYESLTGNDIAVSGGDISKELIFYINNNPPIELYPTLEITNIVDGNSCDADDPTPFSVIINAMPEVGKYE